MLRLLWKTSRSGVRTLENSCYNLSTVCTVIEFATNSDRNLEERKNILTNKHSTMVMNTSSKPRETFVLTRGQYDAPTLRVTPRTPKILPPLRRRGDGARADGKKNGKDIQLTRLDLANWLTDSNHPLTARVAVNRIWALFSGPELFQRQLILAHRGNIRVTRTC